MWKKLCALLIAGMLAAGLPIDGQADAELSKFNMSYIYYGKTAELIQNVDQAHGGLQVISPNYFELADDGSLHLSDSLDSTFIDAMHARNIRVVPFLNNDWDPILARKVLKIKDTFTTQIAEAIKQYHLDGINVDLENLSDMDRDDLTVFMKQLRAKLPAGSELSVAVPANPEGNTTGYAASIDMKSLVNVCDYFMLMAYDEHFPGDLNVGPVASLPFVEKSIQYALTQVSPDKLVLGIPFYGRFWNGNPSFNGSGISDATAEKLIATYHGTQNYDERYQSVKGEFTIDPNDPRTTLNSQTLPNGYYTVWFENERSTKAKLELVQRYHLKGSGSWSLNDVSADTWNYYNLWLNGHYYTDAESHWAQSAILAMANKGWMEGISDSLFAPEQALTRAQAAVILVRAMEHGAVEAGDKANASPFVDVPQNHWAYKEITIAKEKGLIDGVQNGLFAPEQTLTREQLCALIVRLFAPPTASSPLPFADVAVSDWSYSAIASMNSNHLVEGFGDGTFRPKASITRAQMAVLMNRIAPRISP